MSSNLVQPLTASTGFIDIASYDALEAYLYGGPHAITQFVSSVQKSNWFTFIPISLRHVSGTPSLGANNVAAAINRSADYAINIYFRCQFPLIGLRTPAAGVYAADASVAWTNNLMHNLVRKVQLTFNELLVQEFDNYFLDAYHQFKVSADKKTVYENMIGSVDTMTTLGGNPTAGSTRPNAVGDGAYRTLPLPFYWCEDTGVALQIAALPFNEIKVNYQFRALSELVVVFPGTVGAANVPTVNDVVVWSDTTTPTTTAPDMLNPETVSHYVVVHNDERIKMGDAPRDVLIHQVQEASIQPFKDVTSRTTFDIRYSHAVIGILFMAENYSLYNLTSGQCGREGSNYTTQSSLARLGATVPTSSASLIGRDPLLAVGLKYENTPRYSGYNDYYAWIAPFYFSDRTPEVTGYHMISYSLKFWSQDPMGSTEYGKLANVSMEYDCSTAAQAAASTTAPTGFLNGASVALTFPVGGANVVFPQKWNHVNLVYSWNIGRVANGSFGHPSL